MIKNKRFDDITIHLFEEQYRDALYKFKLSERQRIYSSLPKEVLDDALEDPNRVANVVFNEKEEIIGFLSFTNTINMKGMTHQKKSSIFVLYPLTKRIKVMGMARKL